MKPIAVVNSVLKRLWLVSPFSRDWPTERIEKAIWFGRFSRWCRGHECRVSNGKPAIYEDLCREELDGQSITYLEFGTFQGRSMRLWLNLCPDGQSRFFGFDTFEGLPEAWEGYPPGYFTTHSMLPDVNDSRCMFVKGLFQLSLPDFLRTYTPRGRQVIHIDADLFSSALFVLNQVGPLLRANDILIFDEFQVWMDEFRAFRLFLSVFPLGYRTLFRSPDWSQVVVKIVSTSPS
ncbi:MAG: hypothetical protein JXQ75_09915 [Phycisphaerae bacterium]|nr:hypothetical protein [Phycisphaerae bacterium]